MFLRALSEQATCQILSGTPALIAKHSPRRRIIRKYSVPVQKHCSSPEDQIAETTQTLHDYTTDKRSAGTSHKTAPSINVITKTETHIQTKQLQIRR